MFARTYKYVGTRREKYYRAIVIVCARRRILHKKFKRASDAKEYAERFTKRLTPAKPSPNQGENNA